MICGFISHLIGRKTINIPEIFSSVHGFTGRNVSVGTEKEEVLVAKQLIHKFTHSILSKKHEISFIQSPAESHKEIFQSV